VIISASTRTDIPTFYGDWFLARLRAGYCKTVNPYNEKVSNVSLKREDVDGFVFWTKNLGPFMNKLEIIRQLGYPFYIQYTIHNYPRQLESSVVSAKHSINYLKNVAANYGPRTAVWRYDPIIFSSITPRDSHIQNFEYIAKELDGSTDEVVISFAKIYKKTFYNMNSASKEDGFTWEDPSNEIKLDLAKELADIAKLYNMKLTTCAQPLFTPPGKSKAHCVDIRRLSDIAGYPIYAKLKGNRKDCGCYESKDIGEYDTCPHRCVYCYAVLNRELAQRRHNEHDPNSEFLITPKFNPISNEPRQPNLFDFVE
jgi:hypothetical protein